MVGVSVNAITLKRDEAAPRKDGMTAAILPETLIVETPHLWLPIMGFVFAAASLFLEVGYRVDDPTIGSKLAYYIISAAISYAALKRKLWPRLAWGVSGMLQATAISTGGMMLAYAAASLDMPLVDEKLLRFDRAVGYRWEVYAEFVHAHPGLSNLLIFFYMLIFGLPIITTFMLARSGHLRHINRYLFATAIAITLTSAIFALCPALTAWNYLKIDPGLMQHFKFLPNATSGWERDLLDIRAGRGFLLHNTNGSGLIAFPSYHCIAGLIFVWALWPIMWLRLPTIIAASLLIAAAPIFGGHYFADIVGGAIVTLISVAAAHLLEHRWHRRHQTRR